MSKLIKEIKSCMSELRREGENKASASFFFPQEFVGFKGHFPGNPVLPGVCKVQAVMIMLESLKNKNVRLKEIAAAKFFSPVSPGQKIDINLEEEVESESEALIKAIVQSAEKKVADLRLKVSFLE